MTTELENDLRAVEGLRLRLDEPLSRHTALRVGGPANQYVVATHFEALEKALKLFEAHGTRWRLLWPMDDWIVTDTGLQDLVIRPGLGFESIRLVDGHIEMGSASLWSGLVLLGDEGWWTSLSHWPGSVGGLFQRGDTALLKGICAEVRWLTHKGTQTVAVSQDMVPPAPSDRAVLLGITLRPGLRLKRKTNGRDGPRRHGTLFEEPPSNSADNATAAELLATTGLAGTRLRSWRLSETEPGTVVQLGGGSCEDLMLLCAGVRERIEKRTGVKLEFRQPARSAPIKKPSRHDLLAKLEQMAKTALAEPESETVGTPDE
jgi:UDP-N-acetylmuramate dehydrogenase